MYNINNHYSFIFNLANSIIPWSVIQYLHPFGATQKENIETINVGSENTVYETGLTAGGFGVRIFCYDQEPLLAEYNRELLEYVNSTRLSTRDDGSVTPQQRLSIVLINTELDSDEKDKILRDFNFVDCYYFYHIFAAHDWYRAYYYDKQITDPSTRKLSKKFITLNRLTSNSRVYRSLLVNELIKYGLVECGHISYSRTCPLGGDFKQQLFDNASTFNIPDQLVQQTIENIESTPYPLRIDFCDDEYIPNRSFILDSMQYHMESFVHIVTETTYWGRRKHLTEKIFKPIVMKQPFILVGCAHNLEYIKSYGFKTFDKWWSEDYDTIENDIDRMYSIGNIINDICKKDIIELENILKEMQEILEHNFKLFYSRELIDYAWNELDQNLTLALNQAYWSDDYKAFLSRFTPPSPIHLQQVANDKITANIPF